MKLERGLRLAAGLFVLASLGLGYWHSRYWLIMTAIVGFNLFQSGFTGWCPMKSLLRGCGLKSCEEEIKELERRLRMEAAGHE